MSHSTYIAETARHISDRIGRDLQQGVEISQRDLAEDVAWIARQLVRLAEATGRAEAS